VKTVFTVKVVRKDFEHNGVKRNSRKGKGGIDAHV